ncbi:hypothetical protein EV356DRAFT_495889 [Viridothelium virens]|uniref:Mid2 domain-containing protein n=1 Tax=Viridothelium virens TaxID=1048519 RepID=A0A6A6HQC6_VIRVR|nr:hypothetical protein EV356DRAFT_495889 [Viridothelium virens]
MLPSFSFVFIVLLIIQPLCLFSVVSATATCYNIDGSIASNDRPCDNGTSGFTWCCEKDKACLTNTLCGPSPTDPNYGHSSCTDESWQSPMCPHECLASMSPQMSASNLITLLPFSYMRIKGHHLPALYVDDLSGGAAIVLCPGTVSSYCCSNLARDGSYSGCCAATSNMFDLGLPVTIGASSASSVLSSSVASSFSHSSDAIISPTSSRTVSINTPSSVNSTASSSHSSSFTPVPPPQDQSVNKVGVGIGSGLGTVVLLVAVGGCYWWCMRMKRPRSERRLAATSELDGKIVERPVAQARKEVYDLEKRSPMQISGQADKRSEMEVAGSGVSELDAVGSAIVELGAERGEGRIRVWGL